MLPEFEDIVARAGDSRPAGLELGRSREGRPVTGHRFGGGSRKISLIGGCHADEPVGPLLLDRVVAYLAAAGPGDPVLEHFQWWIVPHINPDGAERNRIWSGGVHNRYNLPSYLRHAVRELPGDDIEFGFPRGAGDNGARPENRAVYDWWSTDPRHFDLHVSLHGMGFAGGPWYLVDAAWRERCELLKNRCRRATEALGYSLHDVQRNGEKGFHRIDRGFCTRPNSRAMARFFLDRNDHELAARFRPSSMETIRAMGGDALTLVTEIPLFILHGVGETIEPGDPVAEKWRKRIEIWRQQITAGNTAAVEREIETSGIRALPVDDQMRLQWATIQGGIEQALKSSPGEEQ
jgi:hypothetical protein